jgi:hypothetical protein
MWYWEWEPKQAEDGINLRRQESNHKRVHMGRVRKVSM